MARPDQRSCRSTVFLGDLHFFTDDTLQADLAQDHTGGVLVTISQFGDNARYIHDFVSGLVPHHVTHEYRSVVDAQNAADDLVRAVGHDWSAGCDARSTVLSRS